MAIDFPSSPSNGQQHSHNDILWEWDGSSWNRVGSLTNTSASELVGLGVTQFARADANNVITGTSEDKARFAVVAALKLKVSRNKSAHECLDK